MTFNHALELPTSVTAVMKASAFDNDARGPTLESVVGVLERNGIHTESHKINVRFNPFHDACP